MLLIKRKPHLGWIINLLAILLACFLMMNSLFGSIYVNKLKKEILNLSDNYFLAQKNIFETKESLSKIHSDVYKFILEFEKLKSDKEKINLHNKLIKDIRKNSAAIYSYCKELEKLNFETYMVEIIPSLIHQIKNYTLTTQKKIDNFLEKLPKDSKIVFIFIKEQEESYNKIIFNVEILTRIIQEKIINTKTSDNLLLEYLPTVFIITFLAAAAVGACFIYVSRHEVRKSILENTQQILYEAREYQMDCIETLEICKEMSENGAKQIYEIYKSTKEVDNNEELKFLIEKFKNYTTKIELAFEVRRHLHEQEKKKIDESLEKVKNK